MRAFPGETFNVQVSHGPHVKKSRMGILFVDVLTMLVDFSLQAADYGAVIEERDEEYFKEYFFDTDEGRHTFHVGKV